MQRISFIHGYFSICTNTLAQQYPFVLYTPKDGLVNSRVKKAYQDSKGRMYFLTFGGLSVYDGGRFRSYSTQNGLPLLAFGKEQMFFSLKVLNKHICMLLPKLLY